jgi:hypothetical protein
MKSRLGIVMFFLELNLKWKIHITTLKLVFVVN